ncbi:MAG: NADH-quinone oxidoreductase subunit N [Bdellovibrionales bacterium]|nr:NADH-quinone oxidoreductase subunit N [Bdellovibrionales bacterium]
MEFSFQIIDFLVATPMIALFVASILPLFFKVLKGNKELNPVFVLGCAFIGIISSGGLTITLNASTTYAFSKALVFDGISIWTNITILFVTGFSLLYSRENVSISKNLFSEYVFLVLNSAIGMMIIASANDLIVTFIGIELMSLCLYVIIALGANEKHAKQSAFKYFVLGSFASAILLYGIALIFGSVGSTYLDEVGSIAAGLISTNRLFLIGFAMVIIGYGFKVGAAPFHAWVPDVYEGAPTPVTTFMATGVKIVTFTAFIRLAATQALSGERALEFVNVLEWVAVLTMLIGNIGALRQESFKRMLAYSSVAHAGYAFVGVIASGVGGNVILGASGVIYYIFGYAIMTLGTFGVVTLFEKDENTTLTMDGLKGLASRNPWAAFCITVLLLSLAGIPPTVGFFGKFFIFSAAIKQGFFWVSVWGVLNSVISVYYYLKPVVRMYMNDEEGAPLVGNRQLSQLSVTVMTILVIVVGLASDPFYQYVKTSVSKLF